MSCGTFAGIPFSLPSSILILQHIEFGSCCRGTTASRAKRGAHRAGAVRPCRGTRRGHAAFGGRAARTRRRTRGDKQSTADRDPSARSNTPLFEPPTSDYKFLLDKMLATDVRAISLAAVGASSVTSTGTVRAPPTDPRRACPRHATVRFDRGGRGYPHLLTVWDLARAQRFLLPRTPPVRPKRPPNCAKVHLLCDLTARTVRRH